MSRVENNIENFKRNISSVQNIIELIIFEVKQKDSKKYILRINKLEKLKIKFGVWENDLLDLESLSVRLLTLYKENKVLNDEVSRVNLDKCRRAFFYKIDEMTRGV